jgi:hypothetical protein
VQRVDKIDGRIFLSVLDVASHDEAQYLFDKKKGPNVFRSVSLPTKYFPALVRFRELVDVTLHNFNDDKEARVKQKISLKCTFIEANSSIHGILESILGLHQRPNSNSFFVRIALTCKFFLDNLIKEGRILLDGLPHVVVK